MEICNRNDFQKAGYPRGGQTSETPPPRQLSVIKPLVGEALRLHRFTCFRHTMRLYSLVAIYNFVFPTFPSHFPAFTAPVVKSKFPCGQGASDPFFPMGPNQASNGLTSNRTSGNFYIQKGLRQQKQFYPSGQLATNSLNMLTC